MNVEKLLKFGTILIFIGFFMVFLGMIFAFIQGTGQNDFGGLIMIGPVPIVFGSSPEITITMLVIGLTILIVYLLILKK
ncbi:MAG: TIGR00304 family membrane protein [Methanohalobium sp.]|uniref:TIGR00304 family membrane protein n=1 Tax=Methanohalobium sp. TaxID=2837493 RepID=UPI00397CC890